jgi:hypothetical protein
MFIITETVETLIVHGADVDACGVDKLTPLHICCLRGDYPSLNVILAANPSLTARTKEGKTALQLAEAKGYEDICSRVTQHISVTSGGGSSVKSQGRPREAVTSSRTSPPQASSRQLDRSESRERPHAAALRQSRGLAAANDEDAGISSSAIDVLVTPQSHVASLESETPASSSSGRTARPLPSIPSAGTSSDVEANSPRASSRGTACDQTRTGVEDSGEKKGAGLASTGGRQMPAAKLSSLPVNAPCVPSRTTQPSTTSYTLMGQHISPGHDEASIALRKQLDVEQKERKLLESKVRGLVLLVACDSH